MTALVFLAGALCGAALLLAALYALTRRRPAPRTYLSAEHSDDAMPPRPDVPRAVDPQRGHIRPALLGVMLLLSAGLFATRCAPTQRALLTAAAAPVASPCTPGAQRCDGSAREVCGRDATGDTRWWPADPPYPDGGARTCATRCELTDGGVAVCAAPATDGGAP